MNKYIEFSEIEKKIFKIETVISNLRKSIPVFYKDKDKSFLVFSSDNISKAIFNKIKNCYISINIPRANHLGVKTDKIIAKPINQYEEIEKVLFSNDLYIDDFDNKYDTTLKNLHSMFISAQIIPSAIFMETDISEDYIAFDQSDIEVFNKNISKSFTPTLNTKLQIGTKRPANIITFQSEYSEICHYAIIIGEPIKDHSPLVRVHSSCFTGDILGSLACDCKDQLHTTIKICDETEEFSGGIILYLMQEGRSIGLKNKLRTYNLQEDGKDTIEANNFLGFENDHRDYQIAFQILQHLKISEISLLTNNPNKARTLGESSIKLQEIVSIVTKKNEFNEKYLTTKKERLGHKF